MGILLYVKLFSKEQVVGFFLCASDHPKPESGCVNRHFNALLERKEIILKIFEIHFAAHFKTEKYSYSFSQ